MTPRFKASLLRFARGVISGALATAVLSVQALGPAETFTNPKVVILAFGLGFVNGAILAAEKFLAWSPDPATP